MELMYYFNKYGELLGAESQNDIDKIIASVVIEEQGNNNIDNNVSLTDFLECAVQKRYEMGENDCPIGELS